MLLVAPWIAIQRQPKTPELQDNCESKTQDTPKHVSQEGTADSKCQMWLVRGALLLTRDTADELLAPLTSSPRTSSSQGRLEGAFGAYSGVNENLCLHTYVHSRLGKRLSM